MLLNINFLQLRDHSKFLFALSFSTMKTHEIHCNQHECMLTTATMLSEGQN